MCGWVSDAAAMRRLVIRRSRGAFHSSTRRRLPSPPSCQEPSRGGWVKPPNFLFLRDLAGFTHPMDLPRMMGSKVTEHSRSHPACQSEMSRGHPACPAQVASSCTIRADSRSKNRIPAGRTCRRPSDVLPILLGESCYRGVAEGGPSLPTSRFPCSAEASRSRDRSSSRTARRPVPSRSLADNPRGTIRPCPHHS